MRLFDIKRFAIHDGPGIRTTLFMKGCPLHCVWCHNPEGISYEPTRLFTASKCIHCGAHETEGVEGCPTLALQEAGKDWILDDILKVVEKERQVMEESGGGVTLCGGEPLMHPEALLEVLQALGERGFHRTVDTTFYAAWDTVERVLPHAELFMVDVKHMDDALHRQYTGVGNELVEVFHKSGNKDIFSIVEFQDALGRMRSNDVELHVGFLGQNEWEDIVYEMNNGVLILKRLHVADEAYLLRVSMIGDF